MPVCWLLTTLTSNPPLYAAPFWTFSCLLAASTSNPPLSRSPFGLHPAYLLPSHHSNVQFATLCRSLLDFTLPIYWLPTASTSNPPLYAAPFWTSSWLPTASTSNPPLYAAPLWTSSCLLTTLTSNSPPSTLELEHPLKKHLIFRHKYIHN